MILNYILIILVFINQLPISISDSSHDPNKSLSNFDYEYEQIESSEYFENYTNINTNLKDNNGDEILQTSTTTTTTTTSTVATNPIKNDMTTTLLNDENQTIANIMFNKNDNKITKIATAGDIRSSRSLTTMLTADDINHVASAAATADDTVYKTDNNKNTKQNIKYGTVLTKDFDQHIPALMNNDEISIVNGENGLKTLKDISQKKLPYRIKSRKPGQTSLVIVFDGTGSMENCLIQLRLGAKKIIEKFSNRDDNPIYNYIFVPFRDPHIGPRLITTDQNELLDALDSLKLWGGGDCPESALNGILASLQHALPNSYVYIFTDAIAKDLAYDMDVMTLIQKKQATLTFLLTGFCNSKDSAGYKVFERLASASNGQVYNLKTYDIQDVLIDIKNSLDKRRVALQYLDSAVAKIHNIDVAVDGNLKEFSVSVAGHNPNISIIDPKKQNYYNGKEVLNLENLKVLNVENPITGDWNIHAGSDSAHSVRLTALSDVRFEFGFSLKQPESIAETVFNPLRNNDNILTIVPSNSTLIDNLTHVTITLYNDDKSEMKVPSATNTSTILAVTSSMAEAAATPTATATAPTNKLISFKLNLQRIVSKNGEEYLFVTQPFQPPRQAFKIDISGYDKYGNPLKRLLSTIIQSTEEESPEVYIETDKIEINEREQLTIKCFAESLIPMTIQWKLNDRTLNEIDVEQTYQFDYIIRNAKYNQSGHYECTAKNKQGSTDASINIRIKQLPITVDIPQKYYEIPEYQPKFEIICNIITNDKPTNVRWKYNNKFIDQNSDMENFDFSGTNLIVNMFNQTTSKNITGWYTCIGETVNDIGLAEIVWDKTKVDILYRPNIINKVKSVSIRYGEPLDLKCTTSNNDVRSTDVIKFHWWFKKNGENEIEKQYISNDTMIYIEKFDVDNEGLYLCQANNSIGLDSMEIIVHGIANAKPKIKKFTSNRIIVKANDVVKLLCKCIQCKPLIASYWYGPNFEIFSNKAITKAITLTTPTAETTITSPIQIFDNMKATRLDILYDYYENIVEYELEIFNITKRNEGIYKCNLFNEYNKNNNNQQTSTNITNFTNTSTMRNISINHKYNQNRHQSNSNNNHGAADDDDDVDDDDEYDKSDGNGEYDYSSMEIYVEVQVKPEIERITLTTVSRKTDDDNNDEHQLAVMIQQQKKKSTNEYNSSSSYKYYQQFENDFNASSMINLTNNDDSAAATIVEGNSIVIECVTSVAGSPEPYFNWYKDNIQMDFNKNVVYHQNKRILQIDNVKESDGGIYKCVAENSVGYSSKSFKLVVFVYPKFVNSKYENPGPVIQMQEIVLPYSVYGIPTPTVIKWLHNGIDLDVGGKYQEIWNNSLRFKASDMDQGIFECRTQNEIGYATQNFTVIVHVPPKIVIDDTDLIVKVNEFTDFTLKCMATGLPFPQITWQNSNEETISSNSDLVLKNISYNIDNTFYTCIAKNIIGMDRKKFYLIVESSPRIIPINQKYRWNENLIILPKDHNIEILCEAIGNPKPNIYWTISNENDVDNILNLKSPLLKLSSQSNKGNYSCIAQNRLGTDVKKLEILIATPPKLVNISNMNSYSTKSNNNIDTNNINSMFQTNKTILIGNSVKFICPYENYNKLNWLKDNKLLQQTIITTVGEESRITTNNTQQQQQQPLYHQLQDNSLNVSIVLADQAGKYTCIAENEAGQGNFSYILNILSPPFIHRLHRYNKTHQNNQQQFINHLHHQQQHQENKYDENNNNIDDDGDSNDNNDADDDDDDGDGKIIKQPRKYQQIYNKDDYQNERYDQNQNHLYYHNNHHQHEQNDINLELYEDKSLELTVQAGEMFKVECVATGNPMPMIKWKNKNKIISDNKFLEISNPNIGDSGQYICDATNDVNAVQKIYNLQVTSPPNYIFSDELEQFVDCMVGGNLTLDCSMTGYPVPTITWKKNNDTFFRPNGEHFIEFHNIQLNENGIYKCYGSNKYGNKIVTFHVVIYEPPIVHLPIDNLTIINTMELRLRCESFGSPLPILSWSLNGHVLITTANLLQENSHLLVETKNSSTTFNRYILIDEMGNILAMSSSSSSLLSTLTSIFNEQNKKRKTNFNNNEKKYGIIDIFLKNNSIALDLIFPTDILTKTTGKYVCVAINAVGKDKKTAFVKILSLPTFKNIIQDNDNNNNDDADDTDGDDAIQQQNIINTEILVGLPFILNCPVTGTPQPTVYWFKNETGMRIQQKQQILPIQSTMLMTKNKNKNNNNMENVKIINSGKSLTVLKSSSSEHNGVYYCLAKNMVGERKRYFNVTVMVPPMLYSNSTNKMHNSSNTKSVTALQTDGNNSSGSKNTGSISDNNGDDITKEIIAKQGDNVQLHCPVSGNPPPEITWLRIYYGINNNNNDDNNTNNTNNNGYKEEILEQQFDKKQKKISSVLSINSINESGTYMCFANSTFGEIKLLFHISLYSPPRLIQQNLVEKQSHSQELHQKRRYYDSNVDNNNDHNENHNDDHDDDNNDADDDDDTDDDDNGVDVSDKNNNFLQPRRHQQYQYQRNQYQKQQKPSTEVSLLKVKLYHGFTLECQVNGEPEPNITWYQNGKVITTTNNKNVFISTNGQNFRIISANKENSGRYICQATNILGYVQKIYDVEIYVAVHWSPWGFYSGCSATCGQGTRSRRRNCLRSNGKIANHPDDDTCLGENIQTESCQLSPCPINGEWSVWGQWSQCSHSCLIDNYGDISNEEINNVIDVESTRFRIRKCDSPAPSLGGKLCIGLERQIQICNVPFCPIDGRWSDWSVWSACSATCGYGIKARTRQCGNPAAQYGGRYCDGQNVESSICFVKSCAVDGHWSNWSPWSGCSKTCGRGQKFRKRECDSPEPQNGGRTCEGPTVETTICKLNSCRNNVNLLKNMPQPLTRMKMVYSPDEMPPIDYDDSNESNNKYSEVLSTKYIPMTSSILNGDNPSVESGIDNIKGKAVAQNVVELIASLQNSGNSFRDLPQTCINGFELIGEICIDIDECTTNKHNCSDYCINKIGTYQCGCFSDKELSDNHKTCVDPDDLFTKRMTNNENNIICTEGFYSKDGNCEDYDECNAMADDCGLDQKCLNTKGSYLCVPTPCPEDFDRNESTGLCSKICSNLTMSPYTHMYNDNDDDDINHNSNDNDDGNTSCNIDDKNNLITKTIVYFIISVQRSMILANKPIVKLINYDLNQKPLELTNFSFDKKIINDDDDGSFVLETIPNKRGIAYLYIDNEENIKYEKVYKLKINGQSMDKVNVTKRIYDTKFILYIYINS